MSQTPVEQSYDQTIDIVRTAIPQMSQFRIPITPPNYAVWFAYYARTHDRLQHELDALLAHGTPITEAQTRELHARHLASHDRQLDVAKGLLTQIVDALIGQIGRADGDFGRFALALNEIAAELSADPPEAQLTLLMSRAVEETRIALEHSSSLKNRLTELADEIDTLQAELERSHGEAREDPLTGLANRLAVRERIEQLGRDAVNDTHAPCLLIADVDHFKRVNDSWGHLAGDQVLQRIGRELSGIVRGNDLVARYGGEEFVVLLRDTPRSGCKTVAENIRAGVAGGASIPAGRTAGDAPIAVTLSIGGAWLRDGEPLDALIARADRALYLSKQRGRNRISWEDDAGGA